MNHEELTRIITANGTVPYGVGISPNPFSQRQAEWVRRRKTIDIRNAITRKIDAIFEERFVTPPETAECIEALVTMTSAKNILEVGMCTGFGSLHILRAIVGKTNHRLTSIDARPAHDREFFGRKEFLPHFRFVEGWTPQILDEFMGTCFDLVFVDSDHTVEHSEKELEMLLKLTATGSVFLFHDCPSRDQPDKPPHSGVFWNWLHEKINQNIWRGTCLRTAEQLDCADAWGKGYPLDCSPGLGIFVRK